MITKRIFNRLGLLLILSSFAFFTSCDKDDTPGDPSDAVTLNMLNELNGKTFLGASNVYINKSNNFYTSTNFISEAGRADGLGTTIAPKLNNLAREVAVTPGHIYQVFDRETIREFPSGARAIDGSAAYYKVYVVSPVTIDNALAGAVVKYVLTYPNMRGLPAYEYELGHLFDEGDQIEIPLSKGAECVFEEHSGSGEAYAFEISTTGGKLVVTLNKWPDQTYGPYGTYRIYIRLGEVFTVVLFHVGV